MKGIPQTRAIQDNPVFVERNPRKRHVYVQGDQPKTHGYVERNPRTRAILFEGSPQKRPTCVQRDPTKTHTYMEGNPQTRAIQDKPECHKRDLYMCKESHQRLMHMWKETCKRDLHKSNIREKPTPVERDLYLWRETYICGKRTVKEVYTGKISDTHVLAHNIETSQRDLHMWKETYILWKETYICGERRTFVRKRPINDTCTRETLDLHVLPHKRKISDWNLCISKETCICVKETYKRYLYKRNMWITCLATQKGNIWLKPLYIERDVHLCERDL